MDNKYLNVNINNFAKVEWGAGGVKRLSTTKTVVTPKNTTKLTLWGLLRPVYLTVLGQNHHKFFQCVSIIFPWQNSPKFSAGFSL